MNYTTLAFFALCLCLAGDVWSTRYALANGLDEGNPISAYLLKRFGPNSVAASHGAIALGVGFALVEKTLDVWVVWVLVVFFAVVTVRNVWVARKSRVI